MASCTYPFPLAARSSHHSHYHSFLLGADAATLDPLPKPYSAGSLAGPVRALAEPLTLQRWRKLYSGSFPWEPGFGPGHYEPGNVAPHCPLPRDYQRPVRRHAAFDFVQIADPCVSALALVAGDRRVVDRFVELGDGFCERLAPGAAARDAADPHAQPTGMILAGQFFEPNNRWLMPLLHVHTRVLNFTCQPRSPARLHCLDAAPLARAGRKARLGWVERQACALQELGYRSSLCASEPARLRVEGVDERLLTAIEAPRIAVLRLLERLVTGERPCGGGRLEAEMPPAVIAAMASQLEGVLARSLWRMKPEKVDIPTRGPWRTAVRSHLGRLCATSLARLDQAAVRARACLFDNTLIPAPLLDSAHLHAADPAEVDALQQGPADPELCDGPSAEPCLGASAWLAEAFSSALCEVNSRVLAGHQDPSTSALLSLSHRLDGLDCAASSEQLRQSSLFLGGELERRDVRRAAQMGASEQPRWQGVAPEPDLLLGLASVAPAREREGCARSL